MCPADLTKAGEALVAASVSICAHVQSILPSSTDKWQQRSGVESSCMKETVNLTGNKGKVLSNKSPKCAIKKEKRKEKKKRKTTNQAKSYRQ